MMGAGADAGSGEHDQVARFGQEPALAQLTGEQGADLAGVRPAYRPAGRRRVTRQNLPCVWLTTG